MVAEASDGAEAVALLRGTDVDLAILDIAMPRMTGPQAAREISRHREPPRILMLSMHDNEQYFFEALKLGARPPAPHEAIQVFETERHAYYEGS